ncbi:MAG: hypothetical protein JXR04_13225 [Bermanella sp.]
MKGLKKLALVTAVAAAPFAQAELTAMDDALLGEMTGQAGITIDVDLDMTIDAIKYVDTDGNAGGSAVQGAITMKGLTIDNDGAAARIRGITIDADGTDGLVIGLNEIGDELGNGIDITVDAVLINDGSANLQSVNAINAATYNSGSTYDYVDYTTGVVGTDVQANLATAIGSSTEGANAATAAVTAGDFNDGAEYSAALAAGDPTAIGYLAALDPAVAGAAVDAATAQSVGTVIAAAGGGNIGGFKIENFRNYIQDDLVGEYNGVFDMALQDSIGDLTGAGAAGRFVRGEIVINGTGTYNPAGGSTGGLRISGQFGGAIDKAAWVDNNGGEFGIADLGFFHGVDTDGDSIADTIEGMHFTVDIDVVDRASSVAGNGLVGGAIAKGDTIAQLQISNMAIEGTIMMGQIYVGNEAGTQSTSLGSVLVKDIDMTGTTVWVYGH